MSTGLIKSPYAIKIADKTYPVPQRNVVTPYFEWLTKAVVNPLTLRSPSYPEFGSRVATFTNTFEQMKTFFPAIIRSNMQGNDVATIKNKVSDVQSKMKQLTFSPPPGLTAEVAILDKNTQLAKLNESIELNVKALIYFFTKSLDEMVIGQQVGLIERFSPTVCRFHFFTDTHDVKETILNRVHTQQDRTHTETTTKETRWTSERARHQHDLVDVKELGVDAYVPFRVERLVETIPDLFKQYFRVVTGNQIFEHVVKDVEVRVQRDNQSRTWTEPVPEPARSVWQYDPALVIGDYVVAGWDSKEELASRTIDCELKEAVKSRRLVDWGYKMVRAVAHTCGMGQATNLAGEANDRKVFHDWYKAYMANHE